MVISPPYLKLRGREIKPFFSVSSVLMMVIRVIVGRQSPDILVSSVRSSNSHPDLLVTQHPPTFSDHTDPQHWTFTF